MTIADESLKSTGLTSSDMETSEKLPMSSEWMCFGGDSLVRTSATPESASESEASEADYGLSLPALFAWFDRDLSLWRTFQRSLVEGWDEFSETWPAAGTMLNGTCCQQLPLVPRTFAKESG